MTDHACTNRDDERAAVLAHLKKVADQLDEYEADLADPAYVLRCFAQQIEAGQHR